MIYTTTVCDHKHKRLAAAINCASTAHPRWSDEFYEDREVMDEGGAVVTTISIAASAQQSQIS